MTRRAIYLIAAIWMAEATSWAGGPIHLKTRDVTAASYPMAEALQAVIAPGHLLVQFEKAPRAEDLRELERRGVRIVGSAPDGGITISVDQPTSLAGLPVQWSGPLQPEDKLSPLLTGVADIGLAAVVVEFHPDVHLRRALALLRAANVEILKHPDLAPNHVLVSATPATLAEIAGLDEVAYIFPASSDLVQGNHVMACTGMLMTAGPVGQYVTVGSGWGGAGADGVVELDYVFAQMSAKMPVASAQSEILRALDEWAKHINVRFIPGTDASLSRTISILFAEGVHGDAYPFEPGSTVLAHTFFPAPPNPEPIAGDMHLNDYQDWHIGSDIDLYTVALHEAGHALGLGHTDDPHDVMYPYYRFGKGLSDDDIAGVQALYGSPGTSPSPAPAPATLSLTITNPAIAALTTTAASISLAGIATGGVGDLRVIWSNDQGGSGPAAGSASWSIVSVPLCIGPNRIVVQVTDSVGHAASVPVTVTRQATSGTTPPPAGPTSLTITSPSMSIVSTSLSTITLSGIASGSVTAVKWTVSTGGSGDAAGTASWTAANIPLLVGTNTVTVRAYDAAGNSTWRAVTVVRE